MTVRTEPARISERRMEMEFEPASDEGKRLLRVHQIIRVGLRRQAQARAVEQSGHEKAA